MSEDQSDKQYEASTQKLNKARQEGDIPRSLEVNSALMYLGLWGAVGLIASVAVPAWLRMAARALGGERWPDQAGQTTYALGWAIAGQAGAAALGGVAVMGLSVLVGMIVQRSISLTPKKLALDFSRISPMKNAKQKFGKSGLVTFAISVGKVALVAVGGWLLFRSLLVLLANTEFMSDLQWASGLGIILQRVLWVAIGASSAFAVLDFLWKRFDHLQRNRMSRKEMMDEHKESEGDPHMKANRRQKAVDLVTSTMLADVERADVVIVNPTHYAVALEWKRGSGRAPVCLAKGVDLVAQRIRERAGQHHVPIWSDPPCARAIHAVVEIGEEIHAEHFAGVAAAIRFAEAMRKKMRAGWGGSGSDGGMSRE